MDRLGTSRAHALRNAMLEARGAYQKAQADYQAVMALAMDAEGNTDSVLGLRRVGRELAMALSAYYNASMAWLTFADAALRERKSR